MVTRQQFDTIKQNHGQYASWAVWAAAGELPKSNMGNLRLLDPDANPRLLPLLNPKVVMLGLNISRPLPILLCNFHPNYPQASDYKIRFAFQGTRYYGAYMTDVVKFLVDTQSASVMGAVRQNPELLERSAAILRAEFRDLGAGKPEIIAFGGDAATLARRILSPVDYSRLVQVTHYSHFIGKENYRRQVLAQLE